MGDVLVAVGDDRVKGMKFPAILSEHIESILREDSVNRA